MNCLKNPTVPETHLSALKEVGTNALISHLGCSNLSGPVVTATEIATRAVLDNSTLIFWAKGFSAFPCGPSCFYSIVLYCERLEIPTSFAANSAVCALARNKVLTDITLCSSGGATLRRYRNIGNYLTHSACCISVQRWTECGYNTCSWPTWRSQLVVNTLVPRRHAGST